VADQKITQLTQLSEASVAAIDVLPIVDISANETKKVTAKDLFEAGATLADSASIDLAKLNQSSTTKLGTVALVDDAITAAKLANDSSINYGPTEPSTDNFEGRGHVNNSTKYLKVYDGTVYQQVIAPTAGIEDLAVTTGKLAANAVTTAKIDATGLGTAAIANLAITAAKIADATITSAKFVAGSVDAAAIATNAVGADELADNAVDTAAIASGAVIEAKLGTGSVTETKIGTGAVTVTKIADASITYTKLNLADGSIPGSKLAADSVGAGQLAADSVNTSELINSAVTGAKIADGTITSAKFVAGAVDSAAIGTNAVGADELADNAVDTAAIVASAVTEAKISSAAVTETKLATAAVTVTKIADGSITYAKLNLANGSIPGAKLAADAVGAGQLAADSVSTTELVNSAVTGAKIADGTITSAKFVVGAVDTAAIGTSAVNTDELAASAVTYAKIQNVSATDKLLGRASAGAGAIEEITLTAAGRALIDDVSVSDQRTTLGLGSLATQNGNSVAITGGTISGITSLTSTTSNIGTVTITGGSITGITDLLVADGGTGASTASGARSNLGVGIGTDVQAFDAGLQSISGLTTAANQTVYTTASDTYAVTDLTGYARTLLDDADASTARTTLGLGTLATQSGTFSGTHSGTSSGTNTGDQTITLTGDVTGSGTGSFAASIATDAVTTAKIATGAVTTDELGAASVTAAKLAANSSTVVSGDAPTGLGAFVGQQWVNTNTGLAYTWNGSIWAQQAGVQSFAFTDSTPLTFSASVSASGLATVTTGLDTQTAATIFAGPSTGSAATPTFRALTSGDLPVATSVTNGAIQPGTGLTVLGTGVLNHTNDATPGTYTKVTIDAEGHVNSASNLVAADVPSLDASKITTGTFTGDFLAPNSVSAAQLADYGIAQVSETAPTPEFAGQWWINPSDRSAYIWIGIVTPAPNGYWLLVGYGSPTQLNIRFAGTYNASTNKVVSLNQYGTEAGLSIGQAVSMPNVQNNGIYLIVTTAGTGTSPAPAVTLATGDWIISEGTGATWTKVPIVSGATGTFNDYDILCNGSYFTPVMSGVANVRGALSLVWGRVQIATTSQLGVVLESTEVLVDNTTGAMSIGMVDDGTY
jgi:hypothetical protein